MICKRKICIVMYLYNLNHKLICSWHDDLMTTRVQLPPEAHFTTVSCVKVQATQTLLPHFSFPGQKHVDLALKLE